MSQHILREFFQVRAPCCREPLGSTALPQYPPAARLNVLLAILTYYLRDHCRPCSHRFSTRQPTRARKGGKPLTCLCSDIRGSHHHIRRRFLPAVRFLRATLPYLMNPSVGIGQTLILSGGVRNKLGSRRRPELPKTFSTSHRAGERGARLHWICDLWIRIAFVLYITI